ncbi:tyrosine-protein kinase receptor UFO-like [Clupea harengus]|uniref:Tyrosine-protein kinase receptor UFO-like n=1 Tax=Clupea harengus TaxID=7950 RepID=A0A8M1KGI9_CLUHA|nr:tyrosine-protein kinase receptor UFO-like [Clupea harengus]
MNDQKWSEPHISFYTQTPLCPSPPSSPPTGLHFVQSPTNVTSSLGKRVRLHCNLQGQGGEDSPPDVVWFQEDVMLEMADTNQIQLHVDEDTWVVISTLTIEEVQLVDMGAYRCAVVDGEKVTLSYKGHIQLEGLPHFSVEPLPMSVVANVSVSLLCVAHGPPRARPHHLAPGRSPPQQSGRPHVQISLLPQPHR